MPYGAFLLRLIRGNNELAVANRRLCEGQNCNARNQGQPFHGMVPLVYFRSLPRFGCFCVKTVVMAQFSERRHPRRLSSIDLLLITIAIAFVILTIAGTRLGDGHMYAASEMAAVRELQTINAAQVQYKSQFQRYAATLAELGPPASGGPGPQAADLIPAQLSSGDKDGYIFTILATTSGYTVNANPKVFNRTGRRTFYTDQSGILRQNRSARPANANSPEFGLPRSN